MNKDLACTQITNEKPSAWTGHRYFAKWLVETLRPEITVDLGVDYGHSTFYLAYLLLDLKLFHKISLTPISPLVYSWFLLLI